MNDDGKSAPVEKWADHVEVIAESNERCAYLRSAFSGPIDEPYGVAELKKTVVEKTIIGETVAALNEFRVRVCGLPAISVAENRIHILEPPDFVAVCGQADGKSLFGHVYLPGGESLATFCFCLAHELVHVAGYLSLRITDSPSPDGKGGRQIMIDEIRDGLLREDVQPSRSAPLFDGLNEAATEAGAKVVRSYFVRRTYALDAQEKQKLLKTAAYEPLLVVCKRLAAALTPPGWAEKLAWQTLLRDYMTGTDVFLNLLEAWLPGSMGTLRTMGKTAEEAVRAAETLGFRAEAEAIRKAYLTAP